MKFTNDIPHSLAIPPSHTFCSSLTFTFLAYPCPLDSRGQRILSWLSWSPVVRTCRARIEETDIETGGELSPWHELERNSFTLAGLHRIVLFRQFEREVSLCGASLFGRRTRPSVEVVAVSAVLRAISYTIPM